MSSSVLVEPAIAFVREKGTARDKALLGVLLGEAPSDEGLEALREGQNPDGGFRVRELPTQASVVGRTAEMVLYLTGVGAADFGCTQAAGDFLIERQLPNGTWGESDALNVPGLPPYFLPGSNEVIGWETSASMLALTGLGLTLDFHAPLAWLGQHRANIAGSRLFRVEAILAALALERHGAAAVEGAAGFKREAEALASFPLEVFELNFALLGASAAGVGQADARVARFGEALAKHQRPDGGFGSGPASSPFETVLALCSLEHGGQLALPRAHKAADHEADPAKSDHGI